MAGINKPGARTAQGRGPLTTVTVPPVRTFGGAAGYHRDLKTETYFRATTVFAGEGQFYENAAKADGRLQYLTQELAVTEDGFQWQQGFLPWLRAEGNIRTATLIQAVDAVLARLENKLGSPYTDQDRHGHRVLAETVMQRPDEPTEMLAYCLSKYGKRIPKPLKRAMADAAVRMWNERAVLRYDKPGKPVRFADLIELCHPKPKAPWQSMLFDHLLAERHNRKDAEGKSWEPPRELKAIRARWQFNHMSPLFRHEMGGTLLSNHRTLFQEGYRQDLELAMAGQWEWLRSWLGERWTAEDINHDIHTDVKPLTDAEQWRLAIPHMGYMAILRNLRNFDQAGIPESLANKLVARIGNRDEVLGSKQFPFRFLSAYLNTPASFRWAHALETGLDYSFPNIPVWEGRTLILIDTSQSMRNHMTNPDDREFRPLRPGQTMPVRPTRLQAGALMALTAAKRNAGRVDVWMFANSQAKLDGITDVPVLRGINIIDSKVGDVGHGTEIGRAVRDTYDGHDRVLISTDEQTFPDKAGNWANPMRGRAQYVEHFGDVGAAVPAGVPVYAFNLSGYTVSALDTGQAGHYELGGLTDATFRMIPQLERGKNGKWPWED